MIAKRHTAAVHAVIHTLRAGAQNAFTHLPGTRPAWVIVELTGSLVARPERARWHGFAIPGLAPRPSIAELAATLAALGKAPWLTGVLFRIEGLHADPVTAYIANVPSLTASGAVSVTAKAQAQIQATVNAIAGGLKTTG